MSRPARAASSSLRTGAGAAGTARAISTSQASSSASGLATLLLDLLTEEEEEIDDKTRELRFDIGLLASRLVVATDWAHAQGELAALPIGYFGASTGAAAALVAAATRREVVHAVVSRGGRPDLADGSARSGQRADAAHRRRP